MGAHAYVTIIATGIALAATAGSLIYVIRILWLVIDRLVSILRSVEAVTETSMPVGPVVDEINRDLESSAKALEACVQRLEARSPPAGTEQPAASGPAARGLSPTARGPSPSDRRQF